MVAHKLKVANPRITIISKQIAIVIIGVFVTGCAVTIGLVVSSKNATFAAIFNSGRQRTFFLGFSPKRLLDSSICFPEGVYSSFGDQPMHISSPGIPKPFH